MTKSYSNSPSFTAVRRALLGATAIASLGFGAQAAAEEAGPVTFNSVLDDLADGKVLFNARLRYEHADFENLTEDAHSVTYRIRAGFETGEALDTKFLVDFDHVSAINDEFNSTINGNTQFPVVADPDVTEVNRLQLTNTSIPDTTVTIGRQRIILDDARFVGNVGWRQNEQTFDAVRLQNTSIKGLTLDVSYIDQVNRIFGDDSPQGRFESDSYLFNASYKVPVEGAKVTAKGYAYLLDFENENVSALATNLSRQTYGGELSVSKGAFSAWGAYATQEAFGNNAGDFSVDYYAASAKFGHKGFVLKGGIEVLGSDGGTVSFVTPLATLHKFNGFADVFLATPPAGLQDIYGQFGYKTKNVGPFALIAANVFYHDFSSDVGSTDYGEEIDAVVAVKFKSMKRVKYLVKYANYSADGFGQDVERLIAQIELAL